MAEPTDDDEAPPTPHDAIFKVVFGEPAHAAVVLRAAFPAALGAVVDWDRLKESPTVIVGAGGRQGARDLRFRTWLRSKTSGGEARVDLLFEHASTPRRRLRLRLNGYMQRGWEATERKPPPSAPLPVILPVVLHQGPGAWTIPELIDLHELPSDLARLVSPYSPRFEVPLFDLGRWTEEALQQLPPGLARLALIVLKAARTDEPSLVDVFGRQAEDVHAVGPSRTLTELVSYTAWVRGERADEEYFDRVRRALDPADREAFMGGVMPWHEPFIEQARVEEARRLLERQLRRRFPDMSEAHLARLEGASLDDLERWSDRFAVASTPDEVFADAVP
jgi:hypothetical protein